MLSTLCHFQSLQIDHFQMVTKTESPREELRLLRVLRVGQLDNHLPSVRLLYKVRGGGGLQG